MLLAPFTLNEVSVDRRTGHAHAAPKVPAWLRLWAIGGIAAVALFPSLRGGGMAGMSVPFWLVAAPMINLIWLMRARGTNLLQTLIRGCRPGSNSQPRVPRRLRSMRRRNSAMMRR